MILASHNSLSYLQPQNPLYRLFRFIYRCQSKTIFEQYEAGVRYFDFRISFNKKGNAEFRHGMVAFKTTPGFLYFTLLELNRRGGVAIRVVLEKFFRSSDIDRFRTLCRWMSESFPDILFLGGKNKSTKLILYNFYIYNPIPVYERYSSVSAKRFKGWWPWRWAKKNNKKYLHKYQDLECYLMLDFI